ncbi:MAG: DNA mismatch repair protein MutS, partial [Spirochaetales bacterium]|nr:DNA mismatch repair protein MutS [Spirochaetales bacterium]
MPEQTTMIEQYRRIKERYKDAILFFRLGDFYEMFNEDALEASTLLDLTLTRRQNQPMCGIPYHAAKSYIARLLKSGRKVAICEQTAIPGRRGLMDREVVEVITPGTAIEDDFLEHGANNYLMSVCVLEGRCCIAYMDVSTGEFRAHASDEKENASEWLRSELFRIAPREILVQQSLLEQPAIGQAVRESAAVVQAHPDWMFDIAHAADILQRHFGVASLRGFGFDRNDPEIAAAGVLLEYAEDMLRQPCIHIRSLVRHDDGAYVSLDEATRKNLELVRNLTDATRRDTLLSVLDLTRTAGGARLMRRWMLQPLRKKVAIEARLEGVSFFYHHQLEMAETRKLLGSVLDMERLLSRLAMNKAHAKDLKALGNSLEAALSLFAYLKECNAVGSGIRILSDDLREEIASVAALLARAILDEPSILLNEGNMIRDGYNPELDRLRALHQDTQGVLERYLEEEKHNTGIQN